MTGLRVCTLAATVALAGVATAQCPFSPIAPADNHGFPGSETVIPNVALPVSVTGDTTVAHPGGLPATNWDPVIVQDGVAIADWPTTGISQDGWWRFEAPSGGLYTFSLCTTDNTECHGDPQLKIFSTDAFGDIVELIAGNDDNCDVNTTSSAVECLSLEAGEIVVIAVDGWQDPGDDGVFGGGDDTPFEGPYELTVSDCEPCAVDVVCPTGGIDENEECGVEQNNLGCFDGIDEGVVAAACGDTVCGTLLRELGTDGSTVFIDIDTFELDVPAGSQIIATANAEFPIEVGEINLTTYGANPYDCANEDGFLSSFAQSGFDCGTAVAAGGCVEGLVRVQVAPARDFPVFFSCDALTWGNEYTVSFECLECNTSCAPGDSFLAHQAEADLVVDPASNSVCCVTQDGAGNGIATALNEQGRGFTVPEDTNITCVEVGVALQADGLGNGTTHPLTINVYNDANGGPPDSGMTLIASETFVDVPPGLSNAVRALTFTNPVAVTAGQTIFVAVEWDCDTDTLPVEDWFGPLFIGGNESAETAKDYFRSLDCGLTGWIDGDGVPELGGATGNNNLVMKVVLSAGTPCPQDLANNDGIVNSDDLFSLLGAWGPCPGCPQDLVNNDDVVNSDDLFNLLGAWGPCP